MKHIRKIILIVLLVIVVLGIMLALLARKEKPETITYGMSFNTMYARELHLDWRATYDAFLDDLEVRHLRLAAHWNMVEPENDRYNFEELDYQIRRAEEVDADVVFAVGRRLPRWPECHEPAWTDSLSWEEEKAEIREYLEVVVNRYKDSDAITYWQVENEPYLTVFATEHCGDLDEEFLKEEIALVRELDPTRPILVTDSGNLGTWLGAYKNGDAFGTSVYVYLWNPDVGPLRTILPPWMYRVKENIVQLLYGEKETFLIELSAEPWLLNPVTEVDLETQFERMNPEKFDEIIEYAKDTRYDMQYLWGGEWWYWLKIHGEPEMWEHAQRVFGASTQKDGQHVPSAAMTIDLTNISPTQRTLLKTIGIEGDSYTLTEASIACAKEKLGEERLIEIVDGATPGPLEMVALGGCI